jgi:hypothetical protein
VIEVTIPGQPPSGNHMYEGYGRNRRKTDKVSSYQEQVTFWVRQATHGFRPGETVIIEFDFRLQRSVDATNAMKVIEDGIAAALCPGLDPPRCCTKYDERFLCRAMARSTGWATPHVVLSIRNAS